MGDSSDYITCAMCHFYEIDTVVSCVGNESGMFQCAEGHHFFCQDCVKDKEVLDKIKKIYEDLKKKIEDPYEISVSKELCPICSKLEAERKDPNATIEKKGTLQLDKRRGVLYFHTEEGTTLRICGLKVPADFGGTLDSIDISLTGDNIVGYNRA